MDHTERRLLLYDRTSHHLYRLAVLLLENKTQAQSVLLQTFSNLMVRGRRATHIDWESELREQVVRNSVSRLPALEYAPLPARRSMYTMPAGARALSILVHYAHIAPETVSAWLNISHTFVLNVLYGLEEATGLSASDLHASWRAEAALMLPPPELRAQISQLRPAPPRMPAWVAASVAIVALMVGLINSNSQAAMPKQHTGAPRRNRAVSTLHPTASPTPVPHPAAEARVTNDDK